MAAFSAPAAHAARSDFRYPTEFAAANDSLLLQINDRRIVALSHRWQVTPGPNGNDGNYT